MVRGLEDISIDEQIDIIENLGNCIDNAIKNGKTDRGGFEIFYPKRLTEMQIKYIVDYFKSEKRYSECIHSGESEEEGIKGHGFKITF